MNKRFDITGLLGVAVRDEQAGIEFYDKYSRQADSAEVRELFAWLKSQEEAHAKRFRSIEGDLETKDQPAQYPDEYIDYLETLVSEGGVEDIAGEWDTATTDAERLALAIRYEKEQLSLQQEISSFINTDYNNVIQMILDEERDHLVRLSNIKKAQT